MFVLIGGLAVLQDLHGESWQLPRLAWPVFNGERPVDAALAALSQMASDARAAPIASPPLKQSTVPAGPDAAPVVVALPATRANVQRANSPASVTQPTQAIVTGSILELSPPNPSPVLQSDSEQSPSPASDTVASTATTGPTPRATPARTRTGATAEPRRQSSAEATGNRERELRALRLSVFGE